jgi:hypothetical protein
MLATNTVVKLSIADSDIAIMLCRYSTFSDRTAIGIDGFSRLLASLALANFLLMNWMI